MMLSETTGEYRLPTLIQQSLTQVLFTGATRPLTVVESDMAPLWQEWLGEQGEVRVAAADATYLTALQEAIAEVQPDCLFLIAPFLPHDELSAKLGKAHRGLDLHEIALQVALEQAPVGCLIGAWMAHGFCLNRSSQPLREQINQTATPRWLIDFTLPPELSAMPLIHLIVVAKENTSDRVLRLFRWPESILWPDPTDNTETRYARQNAILTDLHILKKQGGGTTEFGYVLRQGLPDDALWLFERHHPRYQSHLQDLQTFGGVRSLGELVEIRLGFNPRDMINELIPRQENNRGLPVLEGRDIGQDNWLQYQGGRYRLLPEQAEAYQLQAWDICVRAEMDADQKVKGVLVEAEMLPLVANNSVLVLRPLRDFLFRQFQK